MTKIALLVVVLAACGDEEKAASPEVVALKTECKALLAHIVSISPQAAGKDATKLAAALPVEELDQCTASEAEIRQCMLAAPDVVAVKKCVPSDEVLGCMQKAKKEPAVRAKCWAGDAHAADGIKSE